MKPVLVLLAFATLFALTNGAALYGVITEFSSSFDETMVYTVKIDRTSGRYTNVTANMIYVGGSATLDGISAFDQNNQRYYFTTDYQVAWIYGTDCKNKANLAPINVNAKAILGLTYDNTGDRLVVLYDNANGARSIGLATPGSFRAIGTSPVSFNNGWIQVGAVDESGNYYLAGKVGALPVPSYAIATISLANGQVTNTVNISSNCDVFPEHLVWSNGALVGGAEAASGSNLVYYAVKINPKTGACLKTQLKVSSGIVTAWTYDPTKNVLYLAEATNGASLIYAYDVTSNTLGQPITLQGQGVPESIEFSLHN